MKKHYIGCVLGIILSGCYVHAQEPLTTQGCYYFEKGASTYTFNDSINIRQTPGLQGVIQDTLLLGTEVFIDGSTDSILVASGKSAPWVLVHYAKLDAMKAGYVWGGNLCLTPMRRGNIKFLWGLKGLANRPIKESKEPITVMVAELKVLRNDSLLTQIRWDVRSIESLTYYGAKVLPGYGLKNVQWLLQTMLTGEACGVPAITQYIAWTGERLLLLPQLMSVADAGVFFHEERFVFPKEKNGKPATMYKKILDGVISDHELLTTKNKSVTYFWDGEKAVKQ